MLPEDYAGLDELSAPSPVTLQPEPIRPPEDEAATGHGRNSNFALQPRYPVEAPTPDGVIEGDRGRGRDQEKEEEAGAEEAEAEAEYEVTGTSHEYDNLDELAGPSPVENPFERHRYEHHSLEQTRQQDQEAAETEKERRVDAGSIPAAARTKPQNDHSILEHDTLEARKSASRCGDNETRAAGAFSASDEEHFQSPYNHKSLHAKAVFQLQVSAYLVFCSILATLARLGLQALTVYPGAPIAFSELWANVGGCFIMGYLSEEVTLFRREFEKAIAHQRRNVTSPSDSVSNQDVYRDHEEPDNREAAIVNRARVAHKTAKKTIPAHIGLAVGFCGSFTSYSSFMRDLFLALANQLDTCQYVGDNSVECRETPRSPGESVMAVLAVLFAEVAFSIAALKLGAHAAIALEPITYRLPQLRLRRFLDPLMVLLAVGVWAGVVIITVIPPNRPAISGNTWAQEQWRGKVLFALCLSPVGCLLRFHLALRLNGRIASFPMGTFVANILGTMVLGACWDLQRVSLGVGAGYQVPCEVLQGIQDGFCGCLTTVSTWVMELQGLQRKHAYFYGTVSVGLGLGSLVAIMGSFVWTREPVPLACLI